jgi:hypothetical protein
MNLGTLKKHDLFVTDADLQPVHDFFEREEYKIQNWDDKQDLEMQITLQDLNDGVVID